MPTVFSHPAAPLAIAPWLRRAPRSLVAAAAAASAIPDVDVLAFRFGIPYGHPLGHRGLTHSLLFALLTGMVFAAVYVRTAGRQRVPFAYAATLFVTALASHGLLDAMTDGGRGVGFLIPFSSRRFFLPWRPIRVSPIGASAFATSARVVLASELAWLWLPAIGVALVGLLIRRARAERRLQ